jgi:hypothetical protein
MMVLMALCLVNRRELLGFVNSPQPTWDLGKNYELIIKKKHMIKLLGVELKSN